MAIEKLKKAPGQQDIIVKIDELAADTVSNVKPSDLSEFAKKTQIPTNISQLTNNSGYITADALNGYASQAWVAGTACAYSSGGLKQTDTRATNELPTYYYAKAIAGQNLTFEFKESVAIGLAGQAMYCQLQTNAKWTDATGGNITQTAWVDKNIFIRNSNGSTGWNAWDRLIAASEAVTINTPQTITEPKTFTGGMRLDSAMVGSGSINISGNITGAKVYNAVFNDYAEYRLCKNKIEAGYFVMEDKDNCDYVKLCDTKKPKSKLFAVSDTYGSCMGEAESSVAVALAGRVLVYVENRKKLKVGDKIGVSKFATARKMSKLEVLLHSSRVFGTVSSIPTYEKWGSDKVEINGRIWVNLK